MGPQPYTMPLPQAALALCLVLPPTAEVECSPAFEQRRAGRLGFIQLADWEKGISYNEQTPTKPQMVL